MTTQPAHILAAAQAIQNDARHILDMDNVHLDAARAKRLLVGYMRMLMIAGPGTWTNGDLARVELIVDCITYPLTVQIQRLEQRLAALEKS